MKKSIFSSIICLLMVLCLAGCGKNEATSEATQKESESVETAQPTTETETASTAEDVYIVYTNDIHSYIYNTVKDDNDEDVPGLRMSNIAAMVKDMKAEGKQVLLVDAGDELQGDVYGAFDEGESVIELMNACGYQLATPGNHDFDYGVMTFFNRVEEANHQYISCNFHALVGEGDPFCASRTFNIGGRKIAFIGITTPETITSSTPIYFQNEKGEYIYKIDGTENAADLFECVQKAIDDVKDEADYIIALGHVGIGFDERKSGISSYDIIENTVGLDAFIDGHSHSYMEMEKVKDKDGSDVVLTQTGSYLSHIGILQITDEAITSSCIDSYDNSDTEVAALEADINEKLMEQMGEKIAVLGTTLYIYNPDAPETRVIRSQEMNSGDFLSDSVYWYFNNALDLDCDIAFTNGGGIRTQLESGDITYMNAKSVEPFGNMVCLIETTGQDILDALEMGAEVVGEWDENRKASAENGGFLHVAGMKYTIDTTIPSSVVTTGDGMFASVDGEYRVKDVKIYNRETGEYDDLDVNKTYSVGGINYILRNNGNGLSMFEGDELIVDYVGQDYVILSQYMMSFENDGDYPYIKSENSPLYELAGYQIDYENPYGAERISICTE